MPLEPHGPAPYAPPQTVISVIEAYRDRGLATPFTHEVLGRAGVAESLAQRVLQSMRELGLVDEAGNPTDRFEGLRQARGEEEYKKRLLEWVQDVYRDVLQFTDPATDSPTRVAEAFRGYRPASQRNRMVTLMLRLFEYAGVQTKVAMPREGGAPRIRKGPRSAPRPGQARDRLTLSDSARVYAPKAREAFADLPPGLVGLLRQLPVERGWWTTEEQERFMQAFSAVLGFTLELREPEGVATDAEETA